MFTRWLLTIFPSDLRAGWRLVSANLALWLALATLTALSHPIATSLASRGPGGIGGPSRALLILSTLVGVAAAIASITLFDDAYAKRESDWSRAGRLIIRRAIPFLICATLTVGVSLMVADLVMASVNVILDGTPLVEPMVPVFGIIIYVTLLARFAFVPFLVVLHHWETLPRSLVDPEAKSPTVLAKVPAPLAKLIWPFIISTRLSDGMRWRLAPYLALVYAMRFVGQDLPQSALIFFAAVTFLVGLTAQAILFSYYTARINEEN